MARGISPSDVWAACDALLLSGDRPTIERVRQKIGRGSPNTVSPLLDAWFKGLGARLADPGAFAPPAGIPDPVLQAARHFWEVASAESRRDFDDRLREGMAAAIVNVEAEKERAATADAAAYAASAKLVRAESDLAEAHALLGQERLMRASDLARLDEARHQIERLVAEAREAAASVSGEREQAHRSVEAAVQRSEAAQRRAALDIDAERLARSKADKRADAATTRAAAAEAAARDADLARLQVTAELRAVQAGLHARLTQAEGDLEKERDALRTLRTQLQATLERAHAAEAECKAAQGLLAQVRPARSPARKTRRAAD